MLDPEQFVKAFTQWVGEMVQLEGVIALDGKTVRRSHDKRLGKKAIHMVSAWSAHNRLVLGQVKVAEKSNEITALPQLLQMLVITGCLVTIDAMGCQVDIAEQIVAQKGDYMLAVKGNQKHLHLDIVHLFKHATDENFSQDGFDTHRTVHKNRGRLEIRTCHLTSHPAWLAYIRKHGNWKALKTVLCITTERKVGSKRSQIERRYYICSLSLIHI